MTPALSTELYVWRDEERARVIQIEREREREREREGLREGKTKG